MLRRELLRSDLCRGRTGLRLCSRSGLRLRCRSGLRLCRCPELRLCRGPELWLRRRPELRLRRFGLLRQRLQQLQHVLRSDLRRRLVRLRGRPGLRLCTVGLPSELVTLRRFPAVPLQ